MVPPADGSEAGDGDARGTVIQGRFSDVGEALDTEAVDDVDFIIFLQIKNLQAGVTDADFGEQRGG